MAGAPDLEVVIAGDGPESDRCLFEAEIADAPHPERFHVLPPVSDIWKLMAAVDIVAVPSRWPDPLPRTVMEAMAAGRPVVGYRTGGVPEMIVDGETGLLVEPDDVDGLARTIERLAGDPDLRRRFGAAAAERARGDFSLQAHLDRMEGILAAIPRSDPARAPIWITAGVARKISAANKRGVRRDARREWPSRWR